MLILFLKGTFLGVAITAPVGPINLLCIRRTLHYGRKIGIFTGLGAATADTFFGAVAAFGLSRISSFLVEHQRSMEIIGAVVFIFMGISLLRAKVSGVTDSEKTTPSATKAFTTSLLLTLHNPATVFAFLVAFAAVKISDHPTLLEGSVATLGVFVGATLWWMVLSWGASVLRSKISAKTVHHLNLATGGILLVFAAFLVLKGVTL